VKSEEGVNGKSKKEKKVERKRSQETRRKIGQQERSMELRKKGK